MLQLFNLSIWFGFICVKDKYYLASVLGTADPPLYDSLGNFKRSGLQADRVNKVNIHHVVRNICFAINFYKSICRNCIYSLTEYNGYHTCLACRRSLIQAPEKAHIIMAPAVAAGVGCKDSQCEFPYC